MIFKWEGGRTVTYKMGAQVRGIAHKGLRPSTCTFEPVELMDYLRTVGPDRFHEYLHRCQMACNLDKFKDKD